MATVVRVRRLVNPRKRRAKGRKRSSNPKRHRRRLTPAQIRAGFGGKRAQAGLRGSRKRKARAKHRRRSSNPKVRVVTKTRTRYRTRTKVKYRTRVVKVRAKSRPKHRRRSRSRSRSSNPALLVTMGPALNPKRRTHVAKHRKRRRKSSRNPRRRHARTRVVTRVRYRTRSRRRSNPRRRHHFRRRNPGLMAGGLRNMGTVVAGGLVGVTLTKTLPAMLPASLISSPLMRVAVSAATAWASGELATRFIGAEFGKYVFFGGLMQAGSVALNAFLPSIGGVIGLSGIRGLTPSGDILLPHNMFANMGSRVAAPGPGTGRSGFAAAWPN